MLNNQINHVKGNQSRIETISQSSFELRYVGWNHRHTGNLWLYPSAYLSPASMKCIIGQYQSNCVVEERVRTQMLPKLSVPDWWSTGSCWLWSAIATCKKKEPRMKWVHSKEGEKWEQFSIIWNNYNIISSQWKQVKRHVVANYVDDILYGSFLVTLAGRLLEVITVGKEAVFGKPALRDPSSIGNFVFDWKIEGRPVRSGLSTGQNFFQA